ncbi:Dynamin family protein [Alicyclobacillus hesperidum]|uniref:Dynamin family protein n=1 Tax=Alicyclobacillus hesperidum TaxID=89784 RepID=A0A1H2RQ70_9BACL|nr:dynamin family protein [Alicyclobacillus hesperidum]SDW21663.1 Dynamin family protein [Alicyclobacillus hesperidum]
MTQDRELYIERLVKLQESVRDISGIDTRFMDTAIARLSQRQMVIAVFGAFSAGKSSVLNAILGRPLLVVSPSPTTAAVTELRGATKDDAKVQIAAKTEEELWRDVESTLQALNRHASDLSAAMAEIDRLTVTQFPVAYRRHVRFLKALRDGYEDMRARLGTTWVASVEDLRAFSADERYAAYVGRVDVQVDDPLLQRGFVFVDTPGVDSIHQRHTNVAFSYMREADAVLFVMYYTHAFSQADREFLLQLAGVQDVSEQNKLFAAINAVDLATSDEEREQVRARVISELRRLGIRQPRVYEVSAQLAEAGRRLAVDATDADALALARSRLRDETWQPDAASLTALCEYAGVDRLQADLIQYVESSADGLAADLARRTLATLREQLVARQREEQLRIAADDAARSSRLRELDELNQRMEAARVDSEVRLVRPLAQELHELLFHAGERLRFAYRDLFREAFHPGRFRLGKPTDKLREAATELAGAIGRRIDIELRTFALRAERLASEVLTGEKTHWEEEMSRLSLAGATHDGSTAGGVQVVDDVLNAAPAHLDGGMFEPFFRHFSSAKQFFEGGGQSAMMEATEPVAMAAAKEILATRGQRLVERCSAQLETALAAYYGSAAKRVANGRGMADQKPDPELVNRLQHVIATLADA